MIVTITPADTKRVKRLMRYISTLPAADRLPVRGHVPGVEYLTGGYGLYGLDWR